MPSSYDLHFHKKVRKENYSQLEQLFFFNDNQYRYYDRIMELVDKYGEPYIEQVDDYITIKLEKLKTDCLFASIGPKLIGTIVYKINHISKSISIIHIAIDTKYNKKEKDNFNIMGFILEKLFEFCGDKNIYKVKIKYINKEISFK